MIYHVLEASAENSKAPFDGLVSKGNLSVDLFFVLSGKSEFGFYRKGLFMALRPKL